MISRRLLVPAWALGSALATNAWAYGEGAPWGAADPQSPEHCAGCHWERDAIDPSQHVTIERLPDAYEPGKRYVFMIHLRGVAAAVSGFQLMATAEGQLAGVFSADPGDNPLTEVSATGNAIRSTRVVQISGTEALWTVVWKAPAEGTCPITFLLAATAANDDQSPFGDQVHYQRFTVPAVPRVLAQ